MAPTHQQSRAFFIPLSDHLRGIVLGTALTVFFLPVTWATDNPGDTLRRQFEAAKASLASGNLDQAEDDYRHTIALGLRQLGNLSISEDQFEQASHLLEADARRRRPAGRSGHRLVSQGRPQESHRVG